MKPERIEENKFVRRVKARGYIAYKMQTKGAYGTNGFNDQLILAACGVTILFEFKRTDTEPEPLQDYRHRQLKKLGHKTYVVDDAEEAFQILIKAVSAAKEAKATLQAKGLPRTVHRVRRTKR